MREDDAIAADPVGTDEAVAEDDVRVDPEPTSPSGDDPPREQDGEAVESLRELVVFLVDNLIDNPEQAEVVADQRGSLVQIQVRLPEVELGKVIGRGGRIAKAIRTALMIAGSRHHLRVSLDIES